MGHSHAAALLPMPGGTYLNPGYWFAERTYARLDARSLALARWADGRAQPLGARTFDEDARAAVHLDPALARSSRL